MPLRSLVEPEEFAVLEAGFEEAWSAIGSDSISDPLMVSAQRERLAHIIIGLWKSGTSDRAALVSGAVQQFLAVAEDTPTPLDIRVDVTEDKQEH